MLFSCITIGIIGEIISSIKAEIFWTLYKCVDKQDLVETQMDDFVSLGNFKTQVIKPATKNNNFFGVSEYKDSIKDRIMGAW